MRATLLLMLLALLPACGGETLQRTVYETLREGERQRCLQQGATDCSQTEDYDDYLQRRRSLEQDQ